MRAYNALTEQFKRHNDQQRWLVAALRADIHNAAGKSFEHHFEAGDFMPGAEDKSVEARAKKLIDAGVPPAKAVAIASSKRSREDNLQILTSTLRMAHENKGKGKRVRAG